MQGPTTQTPTFEIIPISNNQHNSTPSNTLQDTKPSNQVNPTLTQNFNPVLIIKQTTPPKKDIRRPPPFKPPPKFSPESIRMECPHCRESISTNVEKVLNIKAILTAIGTCFVGFVCFQICNNKKIGFHDYIHSCPNCGDEIGAYISM